MPESCTCGAQLPPDALFCHKCGKPQREIVRAGEDAQPEAAPPLPLAAAPPILSIEASMEAPPIGWRNRNAVRVALFGGIFAFVFSALMGPLGVIASFASGFVTVLLYRRLTGLRVSAMDGARLGWIAGVFLFVAALLLFTIGMATQPEMLDQIQKRLSESSTYTQAEIDQVMEILRSPLGIAILVCVVFLSSTLLPAAGGALGAKLLGGGSRPAHHPHA